MAGWEEVPDDDSGPFSGVEPIDDGIVYDYQPGPELAVSRTVVVPLPPDRTAPVRPSTGPAQPWAPGPKVDPKAFRPKPQGPNPVRVFLAVSVPIIVMLCILLAVKDAYGM